MKIVVTEEAQADERRQFSAEVVDGDSFTFSAPLTVSIKGIQRRARKLANVGLAEVEIARLYP